VSAAPPIGTLETISVSLPAAPIPIENIDETSVAAWLAFPKAIHNAPASSGVEANSCAQAPFENAVALAVGCISGFCEMNLVAKLPKKDL
jgi:hypothetical protein